MATILKTIWLRESVVLRKEKLLDAQIDFENILMLDPHHKGALLKLLDVLILRKEKGQAQDVLRSIKAEKYASASDISKAGEKIRALSDKPPVRILYSDSASSSPADESRIDDGFDEDTDDLDDDLDDDMDAAVDTSADDEIDIEKVIDSQYPKESGQGNSSTTSAGEAVKSLEDMSPREQFDLAMKLKKQGDTVKAIRLFVSSVMADPSLLSEPDEGMLLLSRKHYDGLSEKDPKNPKYHFFSGYFSDIFSEYEKAKESYVKVFELAPKDSRLWSVARSKIIVIERTIQNQALAKAVSDKEIEEKKADAFLEAVSKGHHDTFTTALEYADYGQELYGKWTKSKEDSLLSQAIAYYEGAIYLDDKKPAFHYGLALIYIEKAATGEIEYKGKARKALENCIAAGPEPDMKTSAEKLLQSVSK